MTDNVIKSLIISAETLFYVVRELNSVAIFFLERKKSGWGGHD